MIQMKNYIVIILLTGALFDFAGAALTEKTEDFVSGILIHATHYDSAWRVRKDTERPFDYKVAIEVLRAMKKVGMNALIVDIEDGVTYQSHPELKRHYSVPMADLVAVAAEARKLDIEFIPKLNFSKSGRTRHDHWLLPNFDPEKNFMSQREKYYKVAKEIIDEILAECGPVNYFHIGMDEDHWRSVAQYVEDVRELHSYFAERGIRTVIWNDGSYLNLRSHAQVFAEKIHAAAPQLPKDVVHIVWDYDVARPGVLKPFVDLGFEVWVAPGFKPRVIEGWKSIMSEEGGSGLIMTHWIKCSSHNKERILRDIREKGPLMVPKKMK